MIIWGILIVFGVTISSIFDDSTAFKMHCGIDSSLVFNYKWTKVSSLIRYGSIWTLFNAISFTIWDIATLGLYINKVRLLHKYLKSTSTVSQRILSILDKIAIVTLFYDIVAFISVVFVYILFSLESESVLFPIMGHGLIRGWPLLYSYSMFLMMDYNERYYVKFLRFVYRFRLHLGCCCCRYMVIEELNRFGEEKQLSVHMGNDGADKDDQDVARLGDNVSNDTTIIDTKPATIKMDHSQVPRISYDTTMMKSQENDRKLHLPRQSTLPTHTPQNGLFVMTEDNHLDVMDTAKFSNLESEKYVDK